MQTCNKTCSLFLTTQEIDINNNAYITLNMASSGINPLDNDVKIAGNRNKIFVEIFRVLCIIV